MRRECFVAGMLAAGNVAAAYERASDVGLSIAAEQNAVRQDAGARAGFSKIAIR